MLPIVQLVPYLTDRRLECGVSACLKAGPLVDRGQVVDSWTGGQLDRWTVGPVDSWTGGRAGLWNGKNEEVSC